MGLGKCFAIECAKRGRNLILISLEGEFISEVAQQISEEYAIEAVSYETNLTNLENVVALADWIKSNYKIDMLINNAGIGGTSPFEQSSTQYIDTIIQLNMTALVHLSHQLLPLLKIQKSAHILNIASLAAFGPMPYKTIYPASKAFVSSFSRGLNAELKETGVSVSVAYPGGMATNPEIAERMSKHHPIFQATFLSPEQIAEITIKETLAGKSTIIPGFGNKMNRFLFRLMPVKLMLRIVSWSLEKEMAGNEQKSALALNTQEEQREKEEMSN